MDKKRLVLIVIVALAGLYIDFNFVLQMQLAGVRKSDQKIEGLKAQINTFNINFANMQKLKQQGKDLPKNKKTLVAEQDIPSLLEQISLLANKNNVKINAIRPQKEVKDAKASSAQGAVPFIIITELSCGYHQLGAFINDLENAPQLLDVSGLKISQNNLDPMYHRVNLTLRGYAKK